jgi:hypothetical protein
VEETTLIRLDRDVAIVAPWPAVYIAKEASIVVSDLHLGLEDEQERLGVHIPVSLFPRLLRLVLEPIKATGARRLILLGDVKHEFGPPSASEWWAVKRLVSEVRRLGCEPEVVRGNHDNYIVTILKELEVRVHDPSMRLGDLLLSHGHRPLEVERGVRHILIGHEHPAVAIRDELGVRHQFKAFLTGMVGGRRVTVLPSASPYTQGNAINEIPPEERLSPLLRGLDMSGFTAYLIEPGVAVKRFPALRYLT